MHYRRVFHGADTLKELPCKAPPTLLLARGLRPNLEFIKQGRCNKNKGDACRFVHKGVPSVLGGLALEVEWS